MVPSWLWIVFTLSAAFGQTLRNLVQRELTKTLGTAGATHVRFLYGLPFGVVFLLAILAATRLPMPTPTLEVVAWTAVGALTQIAATALLLMAMQSRSFVVVTAYIKTEPVLVAVFGLILLADPLTVTLAVAILVATAGVILMSLPRTAAGDLFSARPMILGIAAAGLFGLGAVGFRGAIIALDGPSYIVNASTTLVLSLTIQVIVLTGYLWATDRKALIALLASWRQSLPGGFLGAFASQMWFLAFALETAAKVRTLALVEIVFAQLLAGQLLKQETGIREWIGIALVAGGVVLLLNG